MEDRLQKFAHLIDAGSFTKAARDLHISQPALSMSVQKLERELHTQLYIRGSHPLEATAAGQEAYKSAKELDASVRNLRLALSEIAEQEVSLSIGMIDSIADIMLANQKTIQTLESQAKVSLAINNSRYLLQALERGDIDAAIIAEQARPSDYSFHYENIGAEPLILVVHKKQKSMLESEIAAGNVQSFISYDQPSRTHAMIEQSFGNMGLYISPRFYSSSPDVIYRLLVAQKGAAALPYRKVRSNITSGLFVPITDNPVMSRRITVATRRNYRPPHILSGALQSLRLDLAQLITHAQQNVGYNVKYK